jgi:DeoR/GlpR family transcriptional regulator of sugar metabolism
MLARQRQARIVDEVRRRGGVRVSDLTSLFDVSDMTVRRDLEELDRRGLVQKVHGGAVLATNSAEEPGFEAKSVRERPEKSALSVAAAGLVSPGQALAVSAGTTTRALATALAAISDITVVTNSVRVAEAFAATAGLARQTVVLTGGIRTPSDALVGPLADATIRSLHVDVLFLGVHGMDPVAGLTTPNLAEAETNRVFLAHAKKVIVVADHTKWRTVGLCTFGPLSAADVLVTDDRLDEDARAVLAETVGELVVAPVRGADVQATH